jgi:hypothetical protein
MPRTPRRRPEARDTHAVWTLLAIGSTLAASGCGSENLYLNGPTTAAVGELTVFDVSADLPCGGKVFGGPSDPTGDLMICHPFHKITEVIAASCDDGACVVESIDPPDANGLVNVNVVGSVAGPTVLRVRARLDDGSELNATANVSFATPTGLHVACGAALVSGYAVGPPYGQCGGFSPVFTNTAWRWAFTFDSDAGPLPAYDPSITIQGSAIAFDSTTDWFQAGPTIGTSEVVIASRLFSESVPVRVVSTAQVVGGEARLVTLSDGLEQPITELGPAPSTLWYPSSYPQQFDGDGSTVSILAALTLADGSRAYGGAGFFTSDHPEICALYEPPEGAYIQWTFLYPQTLATGNVTFSAMVGEASISWPVAVVAPPSP